MNSNFCNNLSPGKTSSSRRRRSTTMIPRNRHQDVRRCPPNPEVRDVLKLHLKIIPRPTKMKHLRPSLTKFLSGKSSLYSVAAALTRVHATEVAHQNVKQQCVLWSRDDIKLHRESKNNHFHNDPPDLPPSLSVKLNCCRSSIVYLIGQGFCPFYYSDFPTVLLFFKMQDTEAVISEVKFLHLVRRASLNNATVCIFVGANNLSTLPLRKGLGTLYFSNGNVISGEAALAMRVARSDKTR